VSPPEERILTEAEESLYRLGTRRYGVFMPPGSEPNEAVLAYVVTMSPGFGGAPQVRQWWAERSLGPIRSRSQVIHQALREGLAYGFGQWGQVPGVVSLAFVTEAER